MNEDQTVPTNWIALTLEQMPPEVRSQMIAEAPMVAEIRAWVINQFEDQTGTKFDPARWLPKDEAQFNKWWWFQYEKGDFSVRRKPRIEHLLHASMSHKVSALAQRHCQVCSGLMPMEMQFPVSVLPIRDHTSVSASARLQELGRISSCNSQTL
jgi:hypothetical protein